SSPRRRSHACSASCSTPPCSHLRGSRSTTGMMRTNAATSNLPTMRSYLKRTIVLVVSALASLGLHAAEKTPFKITVQLDWVAEPEHGGFYQAQARGYFREEG